MLIVAKCIKVHDGDTFTVDIANWPPIIGIGMSIRLNGVDAPEIHDHREDIALVAHKAKTRLEQLILGKFVNLTVRSKDKYFRLDASVCVEDSEDVAIILEREGLVKPYNGQGKKPW